MMEKQTIGDRIQEERKRMRLTQQQFADGLEVNRSTITFYETDRTAPDILFLVRAYAYGIDIWYIMTGERGREVAVELLDWDLFVRTVSTVRAWCLEKKIVLKVEKELAISKILYKHFANRGLIDQDHLNDTLKLAA